MILYYQSHIMSFAMISIMHISKFILSISWILYHISIVLYLTNSMYGFKLQFAILFNRDSVLCTGIFQFN